MTTTASNIQLCTVSMAIGSPPSQIGFTKQAKQVLATALGIDPRAIRGSYAILGAGSHPLMKQGAALKRMLTAIRDRWTIPEYGLRATSGKVENLRMSRISGSFLIENGNVEKFMEEYSQAAQQYLAWGTQVTEEDMYTLIRNLDATNLGQDWPIVEPRYPSREALQASINCEHPNIKPYVASFDLADIAPKTMAKLREQMTARLDASVSGAVAELLCSFQAMVEAVATNCGTRSRLNPPASHPLREKLWLAEVVKRLNSIEVEEAGLDVPSGSFAYLIQAVESTGGSPGKHKGEPQIYVFTVAEYAALLPYETDEYRKLQNSSFENVLALATKIQNITGMLQSDDASTDLLATVEEVKSKLLALGRNASEIARETRQSHVVRTSLKEAMSTLANSLQTQVCKVQQRARVVRKINL
jgi:hypothetical protein